MTERGFSCGGQVFTWAVWSVMTSVQPTASGPLPGGMPRWLLLLLPMARRLAVYLLWSVEMQIIGRSRWTTLRP